MESATRRSTRGAFLNKTRKKKEKRNSRRGNSDLIKSSRLLGEAFLFALTNSEELELRFGL